MKTTQIRQNWGFRSASFWMTFLIALGIIVIGLRFIIVPAAGAAGYGIPIISVNDLAYGRIKGVRDIFSGLVLLPFLFLKMRQAAAIAVTAAIVVPATDFLIVFSSNGSTDVQHLLIHGLTVVYMVATSVLLFRGSTS